MYPSCVLSFLPSRNGRFLTSLNALDLIPSPQTRLVFILKHSIANGSSTSAHKLFLCLLDIQVYLKKKYIGVPVVAQ